jgi:RNA polymerase sigma-70 factor (ECF subfamily)
MDADGSIETLMAGYQQGDFAAASAMVDRVGPQLHRFFAAQSASRADADDLLQETWLRIHKVRHTYRPGEPALPWFYARAAAGERRLEEMSREEAAIAGSRPPRHDLNALLAPLSASQREVIEMLKVAGMSLEDVARATSSTVGAVKQKVHRSYKKLRAELSALGFSGQQSGGVS